ncbi:MAG: BREX system P-loop protein BrxC, partial [Firmicutes bacterium]|nr:BREX system P-loop protein BrxC [Bacillota bacterium]
MKINEMFSRPIDRYISGVIKIGNEENSQQELEEYVVTNELNKYFSQFFDGYSTSINESTKEIGVWISGFYGSGKSHFMKILSYIIDNQTICGKKPIDYFKEGNKITDPMVVANMEKAANLSSDVMLFNIESLSNDSHKSKEAILSVFLRAFNRKLGYDDKNPSVADLERHLEEEGKYEAFKQKYLEVSGKDWIEDRKNIKFRGKHFSNTVEFLDIMTSDDAKNFLKNVHNYYHMSVSDFAQMVYKYCQEKGPQHRVIFLVDEIGQYIADNSELLINLQTIAEDFSTYCKGQAWIVVTSQQNIDEVTRVKGQDFSKIQARFNMRLALSSSDVSEVIQKRVLDKKDYVKDSLMAYYDSKESIIKNLIDFSDTAFKRKYADSENFADVYPFIPYQFDLLGNVLTAVRDNSSSGKHLAEGERSMLALIQESAMSVKQQELGTLVSFDRFYDCLEKWIDHSFRNVIDSAKRNGNLDEFDVRVLKILFMVKYVKEITADVKNLTTMMVDHVDTDRVNLTNKVEKSLKKLVHETCIQKEGDVYIFLTNAEQDLNKAIKNEHVEHSEIVEEIRKIIFGDLLAGTTSKFRYNSRYSFPYNQRIDDKDYTTGHPMGLMIVTPYNENNYTEDDLRPLSNQQNMVIFKLPDEIEFQSDLMSYLQTSKYITRNNTNPDPTFQALKSRKQQEIKDTKARIRLFIENGMKEADVFIGGSKVSLGKKDVKDRVNEALSNIVNTVYTKLPYMTTAPDVQDLHKIFTTSVQGTLGFESEDNQLALDDVFEFIKQREAVSVKLSYKHLLERYMKNPYGYVQNDIHWLVLKLFKMKKIDLKLNGSLISESETSYQTIIKQVTDTKNQDKLILTPKPTIPMKQIKIVNDLCKDLDSSHMNFSESDELMKKCKEYIQAKIAELHKIEVQYVSNPNLPGKDRVIKTKNALSELLSIRDVKEFYQLAEDNEDDILDALEDVEPVLSFFKGSQMKIYNQAMNCMRRYDNSKTYLHSAAINNAMTGIEKIVKDPNLYNKISQLPQLTAIFEQEFKKILDTVKAEKTKELDRIQTEVEAYLVMDQLKAKFAESIKSKFVQFKKQIEETTDLATPYRIVGSDADFEKGKFIKKITEEKQRILDDMNNTDDGGEDTPTPVSTPTVKNITATSLFNNTEVSVVNEQDLNNLLNQIKKKIKDELD